MGQANILDQLSTSDGVFFFSWALLFPYCQSITLMWVWSQQFSLQTSLVQEPFLGGKYESKSQFPSISLHMS